MKLYLKLVFAMVTTSSGLIADNIHCWQMKDSSYKCSAYRGSPRSPTPCNAFGTTWPSKKECLGHCKR